MSKKPKTINETTKKARPVADTKPPRRSLGDIVKNYMKRHETAQLKEVVAGAREEWINDGRVPAKHFAGMVWHAVQACSNPDTSKPGSYRFRKEGETVTERAKPAPIKKPAKKARKSRNAADELPEESEDESEEDKDEDEEDA